MALNYILGPSHIHKILSYQIQNEIDNKILFDNCILDGYIGLPIWARHIFNLIKENTLKNNNVCWMVSDYKFNNFDYTQLVDPVSKYDLFLDVMGYYGNVSKDFMENHHIEFLGNHSLKVIDYIVETFPNIKLIFWCLYKRTRANKSSSYPRHLWYDVVKERYKNNIIDIDLFTTPEEFNAKILDEGGHPNKDGYVLLDTMIKSTFTSQDLHED